jgi:hypothetical protein
MITVPHLPVVSKDIPLEHLGGHLDALQPRHRIEREYFSEASDRSYKPITEFVLAHDNENIIVKYWVQEATMKASYDSDFSQIWKDSAVELFISSDDIPDMYYNFEFNCIGSCLAGRGPHVKDRENISSEHMKSIRRWSSLPRQTFEEKKADIADAKSWFKWELLVVIPHSVFGVIKPSLSSVSIKGNLQKCGDDLSKPHWLSYFPIKTEVPAFHRPDCFGVLKIEPPVIDNPIAQMKAKLHKKDAHKKVELDADQEKALQQSKQKADAKLGKVKNDSPELLNALLKWYQSDADQKALALDHFFASLQAEDLRTLHLVIGSEDLSALNPKSPFVKKSLQWKGLATSHGSLFVKSLDKALENLAHPPPPNKEDLYFALINEFKEHQERHTHEQKPSSASS